MKIKALLGNSLTVTKESKPDNLDPMNNFNYGGEDELGAETVIPAAEAVDATGKPINQQSIADLLINAEVMLGHGETEQMARVLRGSLDLEGNVIGDLDGSLNTLVYDVEFPDGAIKQYAANVIAENVLSQVDHSGFHSQSLSRISQHQRLGNAISKAEGYFTTKRGVKR